MKKLHKIYTGFKALLFLFIAVSSIAKINTSGNNTFLLICISSLALALYFDAIEKLKK